MNGTDRPLRFCDICGGLDSDPRHMRELGEQENSEDGRPDASVLDKIDTNGAPMFAIERILSHSMSEHHHDCGAANGCVTCAAVVAATNGATHDALTELVTANDTSNIRTKVEEALTNG